MRTRLLPLHMGIMAAFVVGCGGRAQDPQAQIGPVDDPFAALGEHLTALQSQCQFVPTATPRTMTVNMVAGEMAFIKRAGTAPDDFLQVNGSECNNPVPLSGATAVQRLNVASTGTGNESVVLDFTNGDFLLSTVAATPNITVNLGAGTADMLGVRLNDAAVPSYFVTYGATGINVAKTSTEVIRDITPTGIEINRVSLGGGNDTFTSRGDTGTGGVFDPGSTGTLEVYGGDGNDTFIEGVAKTPRETINGGNGTDSVSYAQRTGGVTVVLTTAGGAADTTTPDGETGELDDIKDDVEVITGGTGNDLLLGSGSLAETITGGSGNDTITGGAGGDLLVGNDGSDRFVETGSVTASGSDTMQGGNGIDTVDYSARTVGTNSLTLIMDGVSLSGGATENDIIGVDIENVIGGTGPDSIIGNALNNVIQGRGGADTIDGGAGLDTVDYSERATAVTVTLVATPAVAPAVCSATLVQPANADLDLLCDTIENITGGAGNDTLIGGNGPNELVGGDGLDSIVGNDGDDILEGGSATNTDANILIGGPGIDVCYGGASNVKTTCEF